MRKFLSAGLALSTVLLLGVRLMVAQGSATQSGAARVVATLPASGTTALTFTSDGKLLFMADSAHNQVRVLDISTLDTPTEVSTVDLDGGPVALAATADYALVLVSVDKQTAFLEVIAEDSYSRVREYQVINYIDVPASPQGVSISPDSQWGLVFGQTGYIVLELIAADDMVTSPQDTGNSPVIGSALSNDRAFLIHDGSSEIETLTLHSGDAPQPGDSFTVNESPTAIAVNDDGALGAVALESNQVVLFDPTRLTEIATIQVEDGPANHLHFITAGTQVLLAIEIENRTGILIYNVSDTTNLPPPEVAGLSDNVETMAAHGDLMAAADSNSVIIFQVAGS